MVVVATPLRVRPDDRRDTPRRQRTWGRDYTPLAPIVSVQCMCYLCPNKPIENSVIPGLPCRIDRNSRNCSLVLRTTHSTSTKRDAPNKKTTEHSSAFFSSPPQRLQFSHSHHPAFDNERTMVAPLPDSLYIGSNRTTSILPCSKDRPGLTPNAYENSTPNQFVAHPLYHFQCHQPPLVRAMF